MLPSLPPPKKKTSQIHQWPTSLEAAADADPTLSTEPRLSPSPAPEGEALAPPLDAAVPSRADETDAAAAVAAADVDETSFDGKRLLALLLLLRVLVPPPPPSAGRGMYLCPDWTNFGNVEVLGFR